MRGEGNERIARYDGKRLNDLLIRTCVGCICGVLGQIFDRYRYCQLIRRSKRHRHAGNSRYNSRFYIGWSKIERLAMLMLSKINRHVGNSRYNSWTAIPQTKSLLNNHLIRYLGTYRHNMTWEGKETPCHWARVIVLSVNKPEYLESILMTYEEVVEMRMKDMANTGVIICSNCQSTITFLESTSPKFTNSHVLKRRS